MFDWPTYPDIYIKLGSYFSSVMAIFKAGPKILDLINACISTTCFLCISEGHFPRYGASEKF